MSHNLEIIIRPSSTKAGSYDSFLSSHSGDCLVPVVSGKRSVFYDSARALIGMGHDPQATLAMRHDGSHVVSLSGKLGVAAKLTVEEPDRGRLRLKPYRDPSDRLRPVEASPANQNAPLRGWRAA